MMLLAECCSHRPHPLHPPLLRRFRGAAPVQRAVQAGVAESGVSVAYTVLRCDAGPVLAQERVGGVSERSGAGRAFLT